MEIQWLTLTQIFQHARIFNLSLAARSASEPALLGPFQMSPKETTGADELSVIASGGAARDKP